MIPILATVLKVCGKEIAVATAQEFGKVAIRKIQKKAGKKTTRAGLSHLRLNETKIREAAISLANRNTRSEAIKVLSQTSAGAIGAAIAAKYAGEINAPKRDILAQETAKDKDSRTINHDSDVQQREQTRIKDENAQEKVTRYGLNR